MVHKFVKAGILSAGLAIAGVGGKHGYDAYTRHKQLETVEAAIKQRDFVLATKSKDIKQPLLCIDERIPGCKTPNLEEKIQALHPSTLEPLFKEELAVAQQRVAQMQFPLPLEGTVDLVRLSRTLARDFKNISAAYTSLGLHEKAKEFSALQPQVASIDAITAVEEARILLQEKKNPWGAWTRLSSSADALTTIPPSLQKPLFEVGSQSYTVNVTKAAQQVQALGAIENPYQPLMVDKKATTVFAEVERNFMHIKKAHDIYMKIQTAAGMQAVDPVYDSSKIVFMESTLRFINLEIQKLQTIVQTPSQNPAEFRKNVDISDTLITGLLSKAAQVDPANPLLAANVTLFHQAKEESLLNEVESIHAKALQGIERYETTPYARINQEQETQLLTTLKALGAQSAPLFEVLSKTPNTKAKELTQKMNALELRAKRSFVEKHLEVVENLPKLYLQENFPGSYEYDQDLRAYDLTAFQEYVDNHLTIVNAHLTTLRLKTGVAAFEGILPTAEQFAQYDARKKQAQSIPLAAESAYNMFLAKGNIDQAKDAESYVDAQSEFNSVASDVAQSKKTLMEYKQRNASLPLIQNLEQQLQETESKYIVTTIYWEIRAAAIHYTQYLEGSDSAELTADQAKAQGDKHIKNARTTLEMVTDNEQRTTIQGKMKDVQALKEFRPLIVALEELESNYDGVQFNTLPLEDLEDQSDRFERSIDTLNTHFSRMKPYAQHELYTEGTKRFRGLQSSIYNDVAKRAEVLGRATQNPKECLSAYTLAINSTKALVEIGENTRAKKLEGLQNLYKDSCKPQKKTE